MPKSATKRTDGFLASTKTMFEMETLECKVLHGEPYQPGETKTLEPHKPGTGTKAVGGITPETTGCREINFQLVELAPGEEEGAVHIHEHETSGYVLSGKLTLLYGDGLERSTIAEAGSFVFVPAGVPHFVDNPSETEPCAVLLTRYVSEVKAPDIVLPEMERMRVLRKQQRAADKGKAP